jgi:hypothetical protein
MVFWLAELAFANEDFVFFCGMGKSNQDEIITACTKTLANKNVNRSTLANAFATRGNAYLAKSDYDRAIADYTQAIRIDAKTIDEYWSYVFRNRGDAYLSKRDYDRAIADYNKYLRHAQDADVFNSRGVAYERKGDNARALNDFDAALKINPEYPQALSNRGRVVNALAAKPQPDPASIPAAQQPYDKRRVALVIGNSTYASVAALPNPKRDADAVAAGLRGVGFQSVTLLNDAGRDALVGALRAFAREADSSDWALVYFAGHGIEVGGTNYLIPVDAHLASDRDVNAEAISLDQIMTYVEGAKMLRIVILDACRENPFVAKMARKDPSRSVGRGLARFEPAAGSIVVYAAKEGQIALDGDSSNSPFAAALLKNLNTPNLEVRRLFDLVRDDVMEMTGRRQQPFTYHSVSGREEFYFLATQK